MKITSLPTHLLAKLFLLVFYGKHLLFGAEENRSCEYQPKFENKCNCQYYEYVAWVGPHCSNWIDEDPPFCFLSDRHLGKCCPGAVQ